MKSIASAVSASASGQLLPTSSTIQAENSWRRSRMRFAASIRYATRSAALTRLHVANARPAASTACAACSRVAAVKRPITCDGRAGFDEAKYVGPFETSPPITTGCSSPRCARTRSSAFSNVARFSGVEKSVYVVGA